MMYPVIAPLKSAIVSCGQLQHKAAYQLGKMAGGTSTASRRISTESVHPAFKT
jgi:hypothetical protein